MARFTAGNVLNVLVRVPIATFLIHHLSHFLFTHAVLDYLVQVFITNPYYHDQGRGSKDLAELRKMVRFWPPQEGYGYGEFSLLFTISLILYIRIISIPTAVKSIFGISMNPTSFFTTLINFLITPLYASLIPCVFLLPMMRLGETHLFVIALNFGHIITSSYIAYTVWFIFRKREDTEKVKKE